jgi:hypothetical protein
VQNEQRHDLVGEERSDDLCGQPCGEGPLSELLDKVGGKRNSSSSARSKTASVAARTRMRSSSLAAISADSARSNAESIAKIFTGAELNQGKSVFEAGCQPVASEETKSLHKSRMARLSRPFPRKVRLNVLVAICNQVEEAGSSEI